MREVQSNAVRELGATLESARSCLDVVVLHPDEDDPHDPESRHVLAVKCALSLFNTRGLFLPPGGLPAYVCDYDKMRSELITIAEFVDDRFDIATRRLAWESFGTDSWPGFFWADDAKIKRNRIFPEPASRGLAYAFCRAIGARVPRWEEAQRHQRWFLAFADALFGGFRHPLEIRRWSTDWSSYFDPGEALGDSFLWSIFDPLAAHYVVIGTSVQDDW